MQKYKKLKAAALRDAVNAKIRQIAKDKSSKLKSSTVKDCLPEDKSSWIDSVERSQINMFCNDSTTGVSLEWNESNTNSSVSTLEAFEEEMSLEMDVDEEPACEEEICVTDDWIEPVTLSTSEIKARMLAPKPVAVIANMVTSNVNQTIKVQHTTPGMQSLIVDRSFTDTRSVPQPMITSAASASQIFVNKFTNMVTGMPVALVDLPLMPSKPALSLSTDSLHLVSSDVKAPGVFSKLLQGIVCSMNAVPSNTTQSGVQYTADGLGSGKYVLTVVPSSISSPVFKQSERSSDKSVAGADGTVGISENSIVSLTNPEIWTNKPAIVVNDVRQCIPSEKDDLRALFAKLLFVKCMISEQQLLVVKLCKYSLLLKNSNKDLQSRLASMRKRKEQL
jgi:hypothetical protein